MPDYLVQVLSTYDGYPLYEQRVTVPDEPSPHTNLGKLIAAGEIAGKPQQLQIAQALLMCAPEVCPYDCSHCNPEEY